MAEVAAVTAEVDVWRSAKLMIDQHGEDAATEVALRADALLDRGDICGAAREKNWGSLLARRR